MRDPHIQKLCYTVGSGEQISYDDPVPISFSNDLATFELRDEKLIIAPKDHFSDEEAARQIIDPFLLSWEIEADLKSNPETIRFTFEKSYLVDRDPPPPELEQTLKVNVADSVVVGEKLSVHLICRKYPQPPSIFYATPDVETGHHRWINYRNGKEPLQSMAYFVLTLLESIARGRKSRRKAAAKAFQIDQSILELIGKLTSKKGDETTARKAEPGLLFQELSGSEKQWLEQAVRRVILRLGEHASGQPLTQITMIDLPTL